MNYANQDYMHVNYTLIVVYSMLLVTGSQSKNLLILVVLACDLPWPEVYNIQPPWICVQHKWLRGSMVRTLQYPKSEITMLFAFQSKGYRVLN
jgi:hypothetical protein